MNTMQAKQMNEILSRIANALELICLKLDFERLSSVLSKDT